MPTCTTASTRSALRWLAAAVVPIALSACTTTGSSAPRVGKPVTNSTDFSRGAVYEKIDADELDQLTNAYADRYRTLIEDAVAEVLRGNGDPRQRATAMHMLVSSTTSVYDITTNGDPFTQVLDLTVVVTLESQVWIDKDRATVEFGEARGAAVVSAMRRAREEIWEIAARVFTQDQLSALDFLIASWRKQNPGVDDVSFVRFNDFSENRAQSMVTGAASGGGLFEPIGRAVDQARSYERLIERMFYLSKRAPVLVSWQSQAAVDDLLAKPEIGQALGNLDLVSKSVDRLAGEIPELIAREREAVFVELDKRQQQIDGTLAQVRGVVDAAAPIVRDVQAIATTAERLADKAIELKGPVDPDAPPSKPFDVADYQKLLAEASVTLREANTLASNGESLAKSPAIRGLIDDVTKATQERIDSLEEAGSRIIWTLASVLAGLAVLVFALAVLYRETGRRAAASANPRKGAL